MIRPPFPQSIEFDLERGRGPGRLRQLLNTREYVFAPGVYDPLTAQLAMYHEFDAVYLSGYSFAIGHLGMSDLDLYTSTEISDETRRIVAALRRFQLTAAVEDPARTGVGKALSIPPLIVDLDNGGPGLFNLQRNAELVVAAGAAAVHLEDQASPKRCGHMEGKRLVPVEETAAKLRMLRAVADDMGVPDLVVIARTDAVSAVEAPEGKPGLQLAIDRILRCLDTGIPDLVWCEFPTTEVGLFEDFALAIRRRFPQARFAFNYSSSLPWYNQKEPPTFDELAAIGAALIFVSLAAQHAVGVGVTTLFRALRATGASGFAEFQRDEMADPELATRDHHAFSGLPYYAELSDESARNPKK